MTIATIAELEALYAQRYALLQADLEARLATLLEARQAAPPATLQVRTATQQNQDFRTIRQIAPTPPQRRLAS